MASPKKSSNTTSSYLSRIETEIQSNQSRLNMVLGALIVLVVGILIFNYFNKAKSDLGPAQSTTIQEQQQDVTAENLPGKYTVKDGDTLFTIAKNYYNDGYKYTVIAQANNITNPNTIEKGQVLEIPKLEVAMVTPEATPQPAVQPATTDWGPKITDNTYTVVEGDWLSTVAARAYGDIYAYQKLAEANHITNPDLIVPGQVLTIPR